jgi:hypothetical protein
MKNQYPALMRLHLLSFVLLGFLPVLAYTQESGSCAEKLKNAQSLFVKGQVEQVPSMLSECLKSGFNREESLSAYKLIIQAYLLEDNLEMADSTMLTFLKKNPEYQISPTDHSSFVHLFNNFTVKPVVQISVHLGSNVPFLTFINRNSVSSEQVKSNYSVPLVNLYISVEAKFKLGNKTELNFEPGYSQLSFTNTEKILGIGTTSYTESQKRLEFPVSATYSFKTFGKFTLYGRLGAGPAISMGTTATPDFGPADLNGTGHTGSDIVKDASRISFDLFAQTGAGLKFKTRGGFIFTELRSNFGFFNQTKNAGLSAEEQELGFYYYHTDDDFNINALNFTIGYTQIFYKPSKKR